MIKIDTFGWLFTFHVYVVNRRIRFEQNFSRIDFLKENLELH